MKELVTFLGSMAVIFGLALVLSYPMMLLANAVLAPGFLLFVFGVPKLGLLHTYGASLLIGLTFKSGK